MRDSHFFSIITFMSPLEESWKSIVNFIKSNRDGLVVGAILLAVVIWSLSALLTKPKLWIDESISINISRSFMTEGVLSPQTAPGRFFDFPELIQSTGYPVTVLLAGFFKVFGYGVYQARIFMLVWIVVALSLVFLLAKKLFGRESAYGSLLLVASFASFYGSGRTVVGEIPGFVFLFGGLYFFLERERYFLTGIFWGLAVVTKPSVFGLLIPAIILTLIFERKDFFRKVILLGCGMVPAALLWVALVLPHPFNTETWLSIGAFYKNPYSSSVFGNVIHNLVRVFHSTTLIYFGCLSLAILGSRLFLKEAKLLTLYTFTLLYSLLAFLYYLRSPGWLRYILIAELLILFILPHVVSVWTAHFKDRYAMVPLSQRSLSGCILAVLVTVQIAQMFTIAKIFSSDEDLRTVAYLKKNFPAASVGLLNAPNVDILLDPTKSFLAVDLTGMPVVGENPILSKNLPDIVVSYSHNRFVEEGKKTLDEWYITETSIGGYSIYKRVQHE